jgi:predicted amidohydrolase YtcJ
VAVATIVAAQQPATPPDTILVNAHVITVDARFSIAEAVAIAGGKFSAVGTNTAIRALAGPRTVTIDLHGETVIPGLADGHLHDAGGGPGVDLSGARSLSDILAAVARSRARSSSRTATGTKRS